MKKTKELGFTLIEILVVTVILGLLIGVASQVFITILRNQNKANLVSEIRQNAALVLDNFERDIRGGSSVEILSLPVAGYDNQGIPAAAIRITNRNGDSITWACSTGDSASTPRENGAFLRGLGTSSPVSLTNIDLENGVSVQNCTITVDNPADIRLVTLDFTVAEGEDANTNFFRSTDLTQADTRFTTTVGLRARSL